ncbi:3-phenylpropionate MFS transporter [Oceanimonas doudoroffii]|uniref:3-phenylpropionate MFS transporter n=1 Tax=Oceanimonas doudoroffii TaxID=84158 RepID=A0A233RIV7_9GAMM|nr:3-phenylpropionate MFS transporter [Oceanimonas doudoroffii]OXY83325.1 3-phenylpropionate MFS transporter [Oceanimonas doudoroffii]
MTPANWLSLFFGLYFFSFGTFLPYWALWLQGAGASAGFIGLLLGLGMAVRCLGNLGVMSCIRTATHLVPAIRGLALASLLVFTAFYGWQSSVALLVLTLLANLIYSSLIPAGEAMACRYIVQVQLDYGRARLWGSVAFIGANLVVGMLNDHFGSQWILHGMVLSLALLSLLSFAPISPAPQEPATGRRAASLLQVLKRPGVGRFLLVTSLLQGSHAFYYGFSALHWQQQGYNSSIIGYLWGLGVLAEILVFMFYKRWLGHWSASGLLMAGMICALCRWLLLGATTDPFWLVLAQVLHAGSFGFTHLGAVRFISGELAGEAAFGAQALYAAVSSGLAPGLLLMLSGLLYPSLGGHTYWLMAAAVLPVAWLLTGPLNKEQAQS